LEVVGLLIYLKGYLKNQQIGTFLSEKEKSENWKVAEGFIEKGRNPKSASFITGRKYLPSEAFDEHGIDWSKVETCKIKTFYRKGSEAVYTAPHLLIKENIGKEKLAVFLSDEYLVFRANIIGINAPKDQREDLVELEHFLKTHSDILRFHIYATSSQLSVSKATVPLKEDFMNLPYPKQGKTLRVSKAESIIIKEALLYQKKKQKENLERSASKKQLEIFSSIFCDTLNSVYEKQAKKFSLDAILDADKYFGVHFTYSHKQTKPLVDGAGEIQKYLDQMIPGPNGKVTRTTRILKYYSKDSIFIAKPKNLKYWLQSIAFRDADETFTDYIKSGF
jgi:hypothetical protein